MRRQSGDLRLHGLDAITGIGMIGEELRGMTAGFPLELLEEMSHLDGVVAGRIHDPGPRSVGLAFIGA